MFSLKRSSILVCILCFLPFLTNAAVDCQSLANTMWTGQVAVNNKVVPLVVNIHNINLGILNAEVNGKPWVINCQYRRDPYEPTGWIVILGFRPKDQNDEKGLMSDYMGTAPKASLTLTRMKFIDGVWDDKPVDTGQTYLLKS